MINYHTDYMLGLWIEHGESELVKAMEETLVFSQAGAAVLSGCARIVNEKPDSILWGQVSAMITVLYENQLVTKPDIEAGMVALAHTAFGLSNIHRFGKFFVLLAVKNLYTLEQLCITTSAVSEFTLNARRVNLIRVCMGRMVTLKGLEFTKKYFREPHKRTLLEEYLGTPAFSDLLVEFNLCSERLMAC